MKKFTIMISIISIALSGIFGCAGIRPTVFIHDEFDFNFLEKVAVIPFNNLSKDQGAGAKATKVFISELLSAEAFDVLEPGEVSRILQKNSIVRTDELSREQIVKIGSEMKVNAIFLGTVTESALTRSGSSTDMTITIISRMVETETGATVWSVTHTANNRSFWSSFFGTRKKSQSEVMRKCVEKLLKTLIK